MILTFLIFPHPCVGLWNETLLYSQYHSIHQQPSEISLPLLFSQWNEKIWQENLSNIKTILTCSGPGPFTALRMAKAFAQGLLFGLKNATLHMPSFFDLFPLDPTVAIYTGTSKWALSEPQTTSSPPSHLISSEHMSPQDTLSLLKRMRLYVQNFDT